MGEAKARGTKQERTEGAIEQKEAVSEAIENRRYAKGLAWLVIEDTKSIPVMDSDGAVVVGDDGEDVYGPDVDGWAMMVPEDIPEWIKQDGLIKELIDGAEVSSRPTEGSRWYRGNVCTPQPVSDEAIH